METSQSVIIALIVVSALNLAASAVGLVLAWRAQKSWTALVTALRNARRGR
jgi:nitrogen fixation protein FixH